MSPLLCSGFHVTGIQLVPVTGASQSASSMAPRLHAELVASGPVVLGEGEGMGHDHSWIWWRRFITDLREKADRDIWERPE